MKERFKSLFSSQGIRGPVLTLVSGSSTALIIAFSVHPILTRLYSEAEFGVYGYFANIMAILITFTSLRYEDAVMLPERDRDAGAVVWLGVLILSFFTLLTGAAAFWRQDIAAAVNMAGVAPYLVLVPITLVAMRSTKLMELWMTRKRSFRSISGSQVANTSTTAAMRLAVGFPAHSADAGGLIGGYLAGHLVAAGILCSMVARRSGRLLARAFSWRSIAEAARRYRRFPLFSTPATVIASLTLRAPVFMLPFFFAYGKEELLGVYHLAFANVSIPFSYFSRAVSQAFFVSAVEARAGAKLDVLTEGVHRRLVMVLLFPMLVILVSGPDLFAVVFGSDWRSSGVYAQYLVPWIFLSSITSPFTRLYDVLQRQRLDFVLGFVSLILVASALYSGGRLQEIRLFLLYLCVGGCLARLVQLSVLLRLARVRLGQFVRPYVRYLLFSLPGLAIMVGVKALGRPVLSLVASVVATGVYGALLLWRERLFR